MSLLLGIDLLGRVIAVGFVFAGALLACGLCGALHDRDAALVIVS
jgi:hypothetical protein